MTKTPTHYDRLGVARNAPEEVIRGAYKALAHKNHPDKNINDPEATATMQAINLAYDILSDPQKRADYDAWLNQEEMREKARTQAVRRQPSSPASGRTSKAAPSRQPYQAKPRSGLGSLIFVVILVAALFTAFFVSGSISLPRLLPPKPSVPASAETFTARETTPRELATCIFMAAKTYGIPPSLLLGLLSAEGGAVGEKTPVSASGYPSYDMGLMQINSFWIPTLAQAWKVNDDIAMRRLRDGACSNIGVGAWILQGALGKSADLRSALALYRLSAHHSEAKADDEDYVDKVIKFMGLYKSIRSPEDLVGQAATK